MGEKENKKAELFELGKITDGLTEIGFETNTPFEMKDNYKWILIYNYPGPLSCLSGVQRGCSAVVHSGTSMGYGRFCDYVVLCAGTTVTIMYNSFQPVG